MSDLDYNQYQNKLILPLNFFGWKIFWGDKFWTTYHNVLIYFQAKMNKEP